MRKIFLIFLLASCFINMHASRTFSTGLDEISLDGTWTVKDFEFGMGMWKPSFRILLVDPLPDPQQLTKDAYPVRIPGCVRQALIEANKIPHPYIEEQAKQSLWVEEKEWWFVRYFDVPDNWKGKLVTLECNMVNYRADVWINQVWIGVTEGNYLRLKMGAENALKYGEKNIITIRMRPPENSTHSIPDLWFMSSRNDPTLQRRNWVTPTNPQNGEFLISSCLFGWDWGTHIVPIGILQPIKLVARNRLQLDGPFMITRNISSDNNAELDFSVSVLNQGNEIHHGIVDLKIHQKGKTQTLLQKSWQVEVPAESTVKLSDSILLANAKLWWPVRLGEQLLYEMDISLRDDAGILSDNAVESFGVRTLQKVANEDPHWLDGIELPESEMVDGEYNWTFVINGKKVFTQGANWIPIDAMLDTHPERYRYILRLGAAAGVNLLRVWGEGLYETDDFYNLCDSLGIMVWQDFWIGSYTPAQSQESSWKAVITNIKRTRNHPSLVLYCGGNEFDASRPDRKQQLDKLIELCERYDPTRDFHKASPHGADEHGGMGIIKQSERSRVYKRYISEGGYYQVWPPRSDMLSFMREEHLFPIYGNEDRLGYRSLKLIKEPAKNEKLYGVARNLDELIHIEALRGVIGWQAQLENTRLEKYKVSGCLFWGFNDIWPLASDHMIFYNGTAKPNYFAFKKAGLPLLATASQQYEVLKPGELYDLSVCLINDYFDSKNDLHVEATIFMGEKGDIVYQKQFSGSVPANGTNCIGKLDWVIPAEPKQHNFLLRLDLFNSNNKFISRNEYTCMIGDENRNSVSGGFFGEYHNWSKNEILPTIKKFPDKMKQLEEKNFLISYKNTSQNIIMGLETLITNLPEGVRFYIDENYIHLTPGEEITLNASLQISERAQIHGPIELIIQTDGWNVKRVIQKKKLNIES
ncbi:hypothetical protein JXQ31_05365 [candidate division KSB1 bacterium]|nr:hypothetical protein [candidate division KSB1 bacterium]